MKNKNQSITLLIVIVNLFSPCYSQEQKQEQKIFNIGTKMEQDANSFFDMCKYKPTDYVKIKAEVDRLYPKGSDSKLLLNALSDFEKKTDAKPSTDFMALSEQGLIPSKEERIKKAKLGNPWKPPINAKVYWFTKRCAEPNDNETNWSVYFLTDLVGKIAAIQLNPFMDNDKNFAARHIKLNFDYFSTQKAMQAALQSLIKPGTARQKVFEFMDNNVEAGVYSKIYRKREPGVTVKGSRGSAYGYISVDEPEIAMRTIPFDYQTIISLDFDESDRLVTIRVVR